MPKMKMDGKSLVPLSILVVPAMVFGGMYLLCDSVLRLNYPIPVIAAVGTLFAFVGAVVWRLISQQRKDEEILSTLQHPYFGEVRQKRNYWETTMTLPGLGEDLEVSGDEGNQPTKTQQATVEWIKEALPQITAEMHDALDDFSRMSRKVPHRPRDLIVESLLLDRAEPKTFCLGFDIKDSELPWGFSAYFTDGELEELVDCH